MNSCGTVPDFEIRLRKCSVILEVLLESNGPVDISQINTESEEAIEKSLAVLKCLEIIKSVLIAIEKSYSSDRGILKELLDDYIVPAIKSNNEVLGVSALNCLGLATLIDRDLALKKMIIFTHAFHTGKSALQMIALKVLFDAVSFYGLAFFDQSAVTISSPFALFIL